MMPARTRPPQSTSAFQQQHFHGPTTNKHAKVPSGMQVLLHICAGKPASQCLTLVGCINSAVCRCRSRLTKLRAVGDPIDFRKQEVAARAALATKAARFVELATGALGDWPASKPWLNETDTAAFGKQVPDCGICHADGHAHMFC
jgi:hypothetical protein